MATSGHGVQAGTPQLPDEQVVPERAGDGKSRAEITWTPLGQALRQLRDGVAAA
jgi:hypothetical protein